MKICTCRSSCTAFTKFARNLSIPSFEASILARSRIWSRNHIWNFIRLLLLMSCTNLILDHSSLSSCSCAINNTNSSYLSSCSLFLRMIPCAWIALPAALGTQEKRARLFTFPLSSFYIVIRVIPSADIAFSAALGTCEILANLIAPTSTWMIL